MTRLRQTAIPADKASWTEVFYTGTLPVVNGVCETDNQNWIGQLQCRGFSIIDEEPVSESSVVTVPRIASPVAVQGSPQQQRRRGRPPRKR